jgi:TusE/DsrC/DsvC family sulfur relay protein
MNRKNPPPNPPVDQEMFLCEFDAWSKEWAMGLARQLGYQELTTDQWKIVAELREQYAQHGTIPNQHNVCKASGLEHFCLDKLFHNNGKDAWKIAGLPNPGEEVKAYL